MFIIICTNCGFEHHLGLGAVLGAMSAECQCGEPLKPDQSEYSSERREEMSDSETRLFIELGCEVCKCRYQRYLDELEQIALSPSDRTFVTQCSDCQADRVVTIKTHRVIHGDQVDELFYPPVNLKGARKFKGHAFTQEVRRRFFSWHDSRNKSKSLKRDLLQRSALNLNARDSGRISSEFGPLPDDARRRASEFFDQKPSSMWSTFSE